MLQVQALVVNWTVGWVENVNPDQAFPRRAIGVNGVWPVPPIIIPTNDTLVLNVVNNLPEATSIHSHGLFQNGTNFMDGAAGITQCGIPPGSSFTYNIPIKQVGTYWIHGHTSGQYVDGLRAPLILQDQSEKTRLNYFEEYTITLSDWYHEEHASLLKTYLGIFNPTGVEPIPKAPLMNEGRPTNLNFTAGRTYRIRIICMSALSSFHFWIDGHNMTLVEMDGVLVNPTLVSSLVVASAQRYSVLVTARNSSSFNYNINAALMMDMFDDPPETLQPLVTGSILYGNNLPSFNASDIQVPDPALFDDTQFKPLTSIPAAKADVSYDYNVKFQLYEDGVNHGAFNEIVYRHATVPTLFSAVSLGSLNTNENLYGMATHTKVLKHMDNVEIVINNHDPGNHPFHLHGHVFQVVAKGDLSTPYRSNSSIDTLENPMRRDTVVVPGGGYVAIRFRADNPGVNLFHCHIEWHLQSGLAAQFIEAPNKLLEMKIPDQVLKTCSAQNIKVTGNAVGLEGDNGLDTSILKVYPDGLKVKGIAALVGTIICALGGLWAVVWFSSD